MCGDEQGSFIVEAALIAPIFLLLLFVIGETILVFVVERSMHRSVAAAAELVRSGHARAADISEEEFKAELCAGLDMVIDCAGNAFFVDVRSFRRLAEIDLEPPLRFDDSYVEAPPFDYGEPGDVIVVRAFYQWRSSPLYASLAVSGVGSGKRLISAFAAFRSGPFAAESPGGLVP